MVTSIAFQPLIKVSIDVLKSIQCYLISFIKAESGTNQCTKVIIRIKICIAQLCNDKSEKKLIS